MWIISNYGFHNKTYIYTINYQILNIILHEVEISLRFKGNYSYVPRLITPNQVMILLFYGKLDNNWKKGENLKEE